MIRYAENITKFIKILEKNSQHLYNNIVIIYNIFITKEGRNKNGSNKHKKRGKRSTYK